MKLTSHRLWLLGAIAIGVIILLTLFAAPSNNQLSHGSTYSRSPEGYGAWYAFMEKRLIPIQRWQKSDLPESKKPISGSGNEKITLLRVNNKLEAERIGDREEKWLEAGNTLVILGVLTPVTKADFTTMHKSPTGLVKIETRRRYDKETQSDKPTQAETKNINTVLGDRFGAVVWQKKIGKGRVILATTPYLAANAYQDEPGNYQFLAKLVAQTGNSIWVDEYIHGYRDKTSGDRTDIANSWIEYLATTPLTSGLLQACIILLILFWAQNRRFGQPQPLVVPAVDNSEAYIQAIAGVLQKAQSREFVAQVVGAAEQLQLQKALGLGTVAIAPDDLVAAWVQQTGLKHSDLQQLLQLNSQKLRFSDPDLLIWLNKWQKVRQHLDLKIKAEIRGKGD